VTGAVDAPLVRESEGFLSQDAMRKERVPGICATSAIEVHPLRSRSAAERGAAVVAMRRRDCDRERSKPRSGSEATSWAIRWNMTWAHRKSSGGGAPELATRAHREHGKYVLTQWAGAGSHEKLDRRSGNTEATAALPSAKREEERGRGPYLEGHPVRSGCCEFGHPSPGSSRCAQVSQDGPSED